MTRTLAAIAVIMIAAAPVSAQDEAPGKLSLGVLPVKLTPAIEEAQRARGADKLSSIRRVGESIESQLVDTLHNTRKFTVVARNDLNEVLKDQDLQKVFSNPDDGATARPFSIAGCRYVVVSTIDDFQDLAQELRGDNGELLATKRDVRLSVSVRVYDSTTGAVLETANLQLTEKDGKQEVSGVSRDGRPDDRVLGAMSVEAGRRAAFRVLDVMFPAKVIAVTGRDQVTLNRGDGTDIATGQVWIVYAVGEELVDPDTGESLGREEAPVGRIQITSVTPKFSKATILEDGGIEKLQVARLAEEGR